MSKPSLEDWNDKMYQTIDLTAEQLDWEHNAARFQESEESMTSYEGRVPSQDVLFALILWYVAKTLYLF